MSITKTLRASALAASLAIALGMAFTPTAAVAAGATATGYTNFTIALQPTVILDYYKEIDLTIPASALMGLTGASPNASTKQSITASAGGTGLTTNAALSTSTGSTGFSAINLDITNAYSVRSIDTSGGSTTVSVAFANKLGGGTHSTATLTGQTNGSATIALSNPATALAAFTGTGLSAASAKYGDVSMTLNLSNALSADTYTGAYIVISATST